MVSYIYDLFTKGPKFHSVLECMIVYHKNTSIMTHTIILLIYAHICHFKHINQFDLFDCMCYFTHLIVYTGLYGSPSPLFSVLLI